MTTPSDIGAVAVTGATGFVGAAIVAALGEAGASPIAVVRPGKRIPRRGLPGEECPVRYRAFAAFEEDELARAFEGARAVVHAASIVHRRGLPASAYERFNVEGTRALVAAARRAGVEQIVFLSSVKVYGEEPVGVVDERTPCHPLAAYAETKLRAERVVLDEAPLPSALRLAPVYGRGDKGNVRTVVRSIARRVFLLPGDGATQKSLVHVSSVADVALRVLAQRATGVFVTADEHAPTMRELADTAARALGRPSPRSLPAPLLSGVARAGDAALRALGAPPRDLAGLVHKSMLSTVFSPGKAQRELGAPCHVDLEWAIRDEIAWLREDGQLPR